MSRLLSLLWKGYMGYLPSSATLPCVILFLERREESLEQLCISFHSSALLVINGVHLACPGVPYRGEARHSLNLAKETRGSVRHVSVSFILHVFFIQCLVRMRQTIDPMFGRGEE